MIGKALPKTEGVWEFQKYSSTYRTASVLDQRGKIHTVNVEELLPAPF